MQSLTTSKRLLFGFLGGVLLAISFQPWASPLAWFSLVPLVVATLGGRPRTAFFAGILYGASFFALTLPWIYTVMRMHGGLGEFSAVLVLALLVLYQSLFPAFFAVLVAKISRAGVGRACFAAPFLWVAVEFARTHVPELGFPWNLLGYSVSANLVLLQITSLTGIYGLSFLVAAFNALAAWAWTAKEPTGNQRAFVLAVAGLLLAIGTQWGQGWVPKPPEPTRVAHLVQVDLPQTTEYGENWMERHEADLAEMEALSIAAGQTRPGLVVWPEVPAPFYLQDARFAARAARIAQESRSYFLLGVVEWKPAAASLPAGARKWEGPYNSAALLNPSGQPVFSYDKMHLVPFGEYVPFGGLLRFARQLTAEVSSFKPGREYAIGDLPGGKFGVLICYEAVFPDHTRRFVANGSGLLFVLSNDAWFGRSAAPEQLLAMTRVRAAENRRWLLRATNNGHTVAVDPYGRIVARLEPDRRGVLAARYDFRTDRTLYTRFGDWFAWLCVVGAAYFVIVVGRQRASTSAKGAEVVKS